MYENMHKGDRVEMVDGRLLGTALSLHHRQDNINPELKLFATYLKVWSEEISDEFFIPTDFVQTIAPQEKLIILSVDFDTIKHNTWNRLPDFVARAQDVEVELPARTDLSQD